MRQGYDMVRTLTIRRMDDVGRCSRANRLPRILACRCCTEPVVFDVLMKFDKTYIFIVVFKNKLFVV